VAAIVDRGNTLVPFPRRSAVDILSFAAEAIGPLLDLEAAPGLRETSAAS